MGGLKLIFGKFFIIKICVNDKTSLQGKFIIKLC